MPEQSFKLDKFRRSYLSAIASFNSGNWDACATACRKTLEGLLHHLNGASGQTDAKNLYAKIESAIEDSSDQLVAPLSKVAHALREGGNIGAHFDLDREVDPHVAKLMIDLLEFLLEYILVLQGRSEELSTRLSGL